jgi:hypothetical protein
VYLSFKIFLNTKASRSRDEKMKAVDVKRGIRRFYDGSIKDLNGLYTLNFIET